MRIVVGITGSSGALYAQEFLKKMYRRYISHCEQMGKSAFKR